MLAWNSTFTVVDYVKFKNKIKFKIFKTKQNKTKQKKKFNIQKTKIMAFGPINSWQIKGEKLLPVTDFIFLAPKSLQMVTAVMRLKDVCSLGGKLWQT